MVLVAGSHWHTAAALAGSLLLFSSPVQGCGFSRLADVHGITAICCESLGDDDCSSGFPATCPSTCANVLVPFWEECGGFIRGLSAATFGFDIRALGVFADTCTNVRSLLHFANGACSSNPAQLQARVLDVQDSCCTQNGVNTCPSGIPWTCNAECAVPFMTFFTSCIEPGVMGVTDLTGYRQLYDSCMSLNPDEKAVLVSNLNSLVGDSSCRVDTSRISSADPTAGALPTSATVDCMDDDDEVRKIFGDGDDVSCTSAAASGMCGVILANSPLACTCSCPTDGSGPVCTNDDAGLQAALGDRSFTCTSAATSGMCSVVSANAPGMCGCSCPETDDGRRRQMGETVCTPRIGMASVAGIENSTEEDVATGTITVDSTDLELMRDGGLQIVAIYFPSVNVARGTTIASASILFDVAEVRPGQSDQKVMIMITGERSSNPSPLSSAPFDLSGRTTTAAGEMWAPHPSGSIHENLATSDISSILNEIASLQGWVAGNPMVILLGHFGGRGVRWVESARESDGVMTPVLRWTTSCSSGTVPTDAAIDLVDGPPQFLPFTGMFLSPTCPLDSIDNSLYTISAACCTELTPCNSNNQSIPSECTFDCNRVFAPFMADCRDTIAALVNHGDATLNADVQLSTLSRLDQYTHICGQFSVATMAAAIYNARCGVCGDNSVDEWLAEQCDVGEANADTPDAPCRTDCTLPRCGDGVEDSVEGCDEGLANSADGDCGPDCQPTFSCPDGGYQFTTPNSGDGQVRNGPTLDELHAHYNAQHNPLADQVTMDPARQGYQQWTVPSTGTYRIEAVGAQGGGYQGNNYAARNGFAGAKMEGTFVLSANQVLTIVVGTAGGTANSGHGDASSSSNGGGGGSFVVRGEEPLIIAGGGAGAWSAQYGGSSGNCDGSMLSDGRGEGQATENAGTVSCNGYLANGGTGGMGGGANCCSNLCGSGGGGFSGYGANGGEQETHSTGGGSFANGLVGGTDGNDNNNDDTDGGWGGFGGGGGACLSSPGGGGGYSGGASSGCWSSYAAATGGASYNAGEDAINTAGGGVEANARPSSDGYVTITCL